MLTIDIVYSSQLAYKILGAYVFFSYFQLPNVKEINLLVVFDILLFRTVGRKLLGLIALALDLDEDFFERVGALNDPAAVVRLLRYPGIYVHQILVGLISILVSRS